MPPKRAFKGAYKKGEDEKHFSRFLRSLKKPLLNGQDRLESRFQGQERRITRCLLVRTAVKVEFRRPGLLRTVFKRPGRWGDRFVYQPSLSTGPDGPEGRLFVPGRAESRTERALGDPLRESR